MHPRLEKSKALLLDRPDLFGDLKVHDRTQLLIELEKLQALERIALTLENMNVRMGAMEQGLDALVSLAEES